jgi:hypothetical protein
LQESNVTTFVYGQVVAKDKFGNLYVVPMVDILPEIQQLYGTRMLSLYDHNSTTQQGQPADAAKMQKEVLGKGKRILGEEQPDAITAMNNLAITLQQQGQLDKAAEMQRDVLEKRKRSLGEEHPDTITAMNNLAITLQQQGQLDKAAKMQKVIRAKWRQILVLFLLFGLAYCLHAVFSFTTFATFACLFFSGLVWAYCLYAVFSFTTFVTFACLFFSGLVWAYCLYAVFSFPIFVTFACLVPPGWVAYRQSTHGLGRKRPYRDIRNLHGF